MKIYLAGIGMDLKGDYFETIPPINFLLSFHFLLNTSAPFHKYHWKRFKRIIDYYENMDSRGDLSNRT